MFFHFLLLFLLLFLMVSTWLQYNNGIYTVGHFLLDNPVLGIPVVPLDIPVLVPSYTPEVPLGSPGQMLMYILVVLLLQRLGIREVVLQQRSHSVQADLDRQGQQMGTC